MSSREEFESWCVARWGGDRDGFARDPAGKYVLSTRIAELERAAAPLTGKYGDVLAPFVAAMERELHANASKGDRPGWLSSTPDALLLEIYWHTAKLSAAVKNNNTAGIREQSADVANMAMMLCDRLVDLTAETKP